MKKAITSILMFAMVLASIAPAVVYAAPNENANANANKNGNGNNGNNGNGNNGNGNPAAQNNEEKLGEVVDEEYDFVDEASGGPSVNAGNNGNQSDPIEKDGNVFPLHQGNRNDWGDAIDWLGYKEGTSFGLNASKGETALVQGYETYGEDGIFWHFINPDKLGGYADITFVNKDGELLYFYNVVSYKNDQHFGVVTDSGWKLLSAEYHPATMPKKGPATQFNLSHTAGKYTPPIDFFGDYGSLSVTASAVEKILEKYYQPMGTKTYQPVWQLTVQPVWQKTLQPVWQKEWQPYQVPTFKRPTASNSANTLTVQGPRNLRDNNGGGEGATAYVVLDLAALRNGAVQTVEVAKSYNNSYDENEQLNEAIGLSFDVQLADGKLVMSYNHDIIKAAYGAFVLDAATYNSGNFNFNSAKKHTATGNTFTIEQYTDLDQDEVYLFFHNAGGMQWFTSKDYDFMGWVYSHTDLVKDDLLRKEIVNDEWLRDDTVSDQWIRNDLVSTSALRNIFIGSKVVTTPYDISNLTMVITSEEHTLFRYEGAIEFVDGLAPGIYTVAIYDGDELVATKDLEVEVDKETTWDFGEIVLDRGETSIYRDPIYLPVFLRKIYADPIILRKTYARPIILEKIYDEDIILEVIKLGSEDPTDPANLPPDGYGKYLN